MKEALDSVLRAVGSNWPLGGLALAMALGHFLFEPSRWWIVFRGRNPATLRGYVATFGMTALLSYTMPLKMGLPTRMLLLKRLMREKAVVVGAVLAFDSFVYYVAWGLAAVIAGVLYVGLNPIGVRPSPLTVVGAAIAIGSVLVLGVAWLRRSGARHRLRSMWLQIKELLTPGTVSWIAGLVVVDVVTQCVRHWAIATLLGISISPWRLAAITVASLFSGMASFLPLGLGAYDGVMVALLVGESIPLALAALVPIVNRGVSLVVAGILGVWGATDQGIRVRALRKSGGQSPG